MAAGGGGAWKVAYADFVTAMMAFFMVMWLTSQKPEIKAAVAEYFRDPFATEPGAAGNDRRAAPHRGRPPGKVRFGGSGINQAGPVQGLKPGLRDAAAPPPDVDALRATVLFDFGKADLTDEAKQTLAEFLPTIEGKRYRIELRAHCVRSPLPPDSPYPDHWEMCYHRCLAVKRELERLGIDPKRLRLSQAEGNEPSTLSLFEDEFAKNSRVDVFMLPEVAGALDAPPEDVIHHQAEGHAAGDAYETAPWLVGLDPQGEHAEHPPAKPSASSAGSAATHEPEAQPHVENVTHP